MPTYRRTNARPSPVLGPVKAIIDQWLAEDEMQPVKQRHTARRIYERLAAEYDFQGAESTVRRYVGQRRRALRTQAFILFPSRDALNTFLRDRCQEEGERRLRGMTTTIADALAEERPHLLPLPSQGAPTYTLHPVQANGFGLVTFQTNRYSVPTDHVHERLWLRAFAFRVEITNGQTLLAVHRRCYGREQDILNPLHYLSLLEQRPGAWD